MNSPETPKLTVDCVVIDRDDHSILLIKRKYQPFKNFFALPGGFVDLNESCESACIRELSEETGLLITKDNLKLIGVYSNPGRDPRRSTVSISYMTLFDRGSQELYAGDDALDAQFESKWKEFEIAFDHKQIIFDAINNLK